MRKLPTSFLAAVVTLALTVGPGAALFACEGLTAEGARLVFASVDETLRVPLQLGFAESESFRRMLEDLRPRVLEHFGAGPWTMSLVQILPTSTSKSVASFRAECGAASLTVNVVFLVATGEIQSVAVRDDGRLGYPGAEVQIGDKVSNRIRAHALGLARALPTRRGAVRRPRATIVRTFGRKNDSTAFVEVGLEASLGLFRRRTFRLVYAVEANNQFHLRAVDQETFESCVRK